MDLHAAVTALQGAIVVVDDHFAPPDFNNIGPDARTEQFKVPYRGSVNPSPSGDWDKMGG